MSTKSAFVHITLPDQISPVLAGRFQFKERDDYAACKGTFEYDPAYLARPDAVEIAPVELGLASGVIETERQTGIFSALRDAGPDAWGRCIIDKVLGGHDWDRAEIDFLLNAPDDHAGALSFGLEEIPPTGQPVFNQLDDVPELIQLANDFYPGGPYEDGSQDSEAECQRFVKSKTALGGMRPKATVEADGALWLTKFPKRDRDHWSNARVEHATMTLARQCGLNVAETDVRCFGEDDVLFVRRFDRHAVEGGYTRTRLISGYTVLECDEFHDERWSYLSLANKLRQISVVNVEVQLLELFRRMCFSSLVSNLDDHPRNHAFIAGREGWQLSPAYDLTPTPSHSASKRDLAMTVGFHGRWANRNNLISQCGHFGIEVGQAETLIDDMKTQIEQTWNPTFRAAGVSEADCEKVRSAFVYEGFSYVV
ncbi:HipA domain-containing protein [Mesorhizobium sp. SP-1A]|uniref:type II toxin-antitoxin system HipA family toxin n=1 Tax=Mesorhizobium sp. SP-1A TaxID=3077840 RepID=UPI0028F6C778|nr:HipA domain-containing protein [Mesorhizobium sp. SP-1A]